MTLEIPTPVRQTARLPVSTGLPAITIVSLLIAALAVAGALAGLLAPEAVYPTAEMRQNSVPNDIVTLVLVVPALLVALVLARQGRLLGLLLWPAALLTILYNALVYALGLPVGWVMLLNLLLVAGAAYTAAALLAMTGVADVQRRLAGRLPERLGGGVLMALSALFFLMAAGTMVAAILNGTPLTDRALMTTDLLIAPFWFLGGLLLWRRAPAGYVLGPVALFLSGLLFAGLFILLLLQPVVTDAAVSLTDLAVIGVATVVALVPVVWTARAIAQSD